MEWIKILKSILAVFLFFDLLASSVHAHSSGEESSSYFKINGEYAAEYHIPQPPVSTFDIPQDMAPDQYKVNDLLTFEIDTTVLQLKKEVVDSIIFNWDFGDGTTATGLKNSHVYRKPGSYILKITSDMRNIDTSSTEQLFQSVMINILSTHSYELPKVVIKANGKRIITPLTDIIEIRTSSDIYLDASESIEGSSKITDYKWNFGDGKSASGAKTTYRYTAEWPIAFPIVRVLDSQGFISDSFVTFRQLNNTPDPSNSSVGTKKMINNQKNTAIFIITGGIITIIFGFIMLSLMKKKEPKTSGR